MKTLKYILLLVFASGFLNAQTITIDAGAQIDLGSGADLCGTNYGNIINNGTLSGTGTQCNGILPVVMSFITFRINLMNVELNWQTNSEVNNFGFEVMRSAKNINSGWTKVGFVPGSGTKNTPTNYKFDDVKLNAGRYYYRIVQIDYNNIREIHNMNGFAEIGLPKAFSLNQNYPNPFNPITKIEFQIPYDSKVTLKVYDISGREIATLINGEFRTADFYSVKFDGSALASGVYLYRISTDKFTAVKKMVLIK